MTNEFLIPDDEEELEDEESTGTDETDEEEDEAEGEAPKPEDNSAKRIKDLQSAKDRAEAEANRLRKQLEGKAPAKGPKDDGKNEGDVPPEFRQWLTAAQERVREGFYASEPRFKEYGVDPALITGNTPEEMKASATQLKKFVSRMESNIRNKVLREHGIAAVAPSGTPAGSKKTYKEMTAEEFERAVQAALNG